MESNLNHATRNFVVYNHRYRTPHATAESQNMYYSFDYSNVHFISYSTETSFLGNFNFDIPILIQKTLLSAILPILVFNQ